MKPWSKQSLKLLQNNINPHSILLSLSVFTLSEKSIDKKHSDIFGDFNPLNVMLFVIMFLDGKQNTNYF